MLLLEQINSKFKKGKIMESKENKNTDNEPTERVAWSEAFALIGIIWAIAYVFVGIFGK